MLGPYDTFICRCIRSLLVDVIACRMFSATPIPEPLFTYCLLGTIVSQSFLFRKCTIQCRPFSSGLNALRPIQNGHHFADDAFNRIFVNENVRISIKFSLKFAPKGPINNIPALVQITAWRRPGDKPLSEPVMVSLLTHIFVTRPQWVNVSMTYFMHSYKIISALDLLTFVCEFLMGGWSRKWFLSQFWCVMDLIWQAKLYIYICGLFL